MTSLLDQQFKTVSDMKAAFKGKLATDCTEHCPVGEWQNVVRHLGTTTRQWDLGDLYDEENPDHNWVVKIIGKSHMPSDDDSTLGDLEHALLTCSRRKKASKPKPKSQEKESGSDDVVDRLGVVSHAAGMAYALKKNDPDAYDMFIELSSTRKEWNIKDFLSCLSSIKKYALQGGTGSLGDVYDISEADYNDWAASKDMTTYVVGPYILMKLAQQARCLRISEGNGLELQRNGTTLVVKSSFELEGDCEKFSKGLAVKGFRFVKYEHIPSHAYLLAEACLRIRKLVRSPATGIVTLEIYKATDITDGRLDKMPRYFGDKISRVNGKREVVFGPLRVALDKAIAEWNASEFTTTDVDIQIERLARICTPYVKESGIEAAQEEADEEFLAMVETFTETLEDVADKPIREKIIQLQTLTKDISQIGALESLKDGRRHRNKTDHMQWAYKNLASYQGNSGIPATDTSLKSERMKDYVDTVLKQPYQNVVMYGAAYAHMADAWQKEGVKVKFIDKVAMQNAHIQVEMGNVYAVDMDFKPSKLPSLIIDDTNTGPLISETEKKQLATVKINVESGRTGDQNKLLKFEKLPDNVSIISKLDMTRFDETQYINFLFPEKNRKWAHVSIVKFGKLHNAEAFLILSNSGRDTTKGDFKRDVVSVYSSIALANQVLSWLEQLGYTNGMVSRSTLNDVWARLVNALPSYWHWYPNVFEKRTEQGSATIGNVTIDLDGDYGEERDIVQRKNFKEKPKTEETREEGGGDTGGGDSSEGKARPEKRGKEDKKKKKEEEAQQDETAQPRKKFGGANLKGKPKKK